MDKNNLVSFFETKLEAEWGPVDLKRALESRAQDIIIVDTRAPEAYQEEHIPQSVNIPTAELSQRLGELPKNKEIVPYCWSITCHLATRAALTLAQEGYRVHELAGGIGTWKEYKMPVETQQAAGVR
jgi:rhodanese-related sulfurtransferase